MTDSDYRSATRELKAEVEAAGGRIEIRVEEILKLSGVVRLTRDARQALCEGLDAEGLLCEPSMLDVQRRARVAISLREESRPPSLRTRAAELATSGGARHVGAFATDVLAFTGGYWASDQFGISRGLSFAVGIAFAVGWHLWWRAEDRMRNKGGLGAGIVSAGLILLLTTGITQQLDDREKRDAHRRESESRREQDAQARRDLQLELSTRRNLRRFNLREADLHDFDLSHKDFSSATFTRSNLKDTYVLRSVFRRATLDGADLSGTILSKADVRDASLVDSTLRNVEVIETRFDRANFVGADLRDIESGGEASYAQATFYLAKAEGVVAPRAIFRASEFGGSEFAGAFLRGADLRDVRMSVRYVRGAVGSGPPKSVGASFEGADLDGARLARSDLAGASFRKASLRGADLSRAYCQRFSTAALDKAIGRQGRLRTDFREADLSHADLSSANLAGADFSEAKLDGVNLVEATYDQSTRWPRGFDPRAAGAIQIPEPAPPSFVIQPQIRASFEVLLRPNGTTIAFERRLAASDVRFVSADETK